MVSMLVLIGVVSPPPQLKASQMPFGKFLDGMTPLKMKVRHNARSIYALIHEARVLDND